MEILSPGFKSQTMLVGYYIQDQDDPQPER